MLKTSLVINYLKKNGQSDFEKIWKSIKDEIILSLTKDLDEIVVKTDLHLSMIEDKKVIMVGKNKWDLANRFSTEETSEIQKKILGDELEKAMDFDDSQEIQVDKFNSDETKEF